MLSMPIIHIALFRWKEKIQSSEIQKALEEVKSLQTKVDGLHAIHCGENFSKWADGFTHAVVVVAQTREALAAYRTHPDHENIAQKIETMEEKSIGVDFEDIA
jgi:hypothetical protein